MRVLTGIILAAALALSPISATAFSIGDEIKLGEEASKVAEKEMPLSKNTQWQQDIQDLGERFTPFVTRRQFKYQFHVITSKDDEINAFALPAGHVYFTERMWKIMTPNERAAVMAHEIIHCDRRHAIDMMIKSQQRMLWMLPLVVLGGPAVGQAAAWGNVIVSQRYSRDMEREADELGMKLLVSAGFNASGAVTSMKKLLYIENDQNRYEYSAILADHPDTKKRVFYLTILANNNGATQAELDLKKVDDPNRLGNVTAKAKDLNVIYAKTDKPLAYGQKVIIKKMLWDDAAKAVVPQSIAEGTVIAPGPLPIITIKASAKAQLSDVMPGDGVFPATPEAGKAATEPAVP